jgi:uncharacterized protein (TIGR03083 family)
MNKERDMSDAVALYVEAARSFSKLVNRIDPAAWDGPGLGAWDLRALVGHTSRALITVLSYLDQPAETEGIDSPQRYFTLAARHSTDSDAVAERGRRAGEQLGTQPARAVQNLVEQVTTKIEQADPDALITTIGGGMRVRTYLPTRTFELVVHTSDIAAATGLDTSFSPAVVGHAAELATRIAVELGEGTAVLAALTGRRPLPKNFSIVR